MDSQGDKSQKRVFKVETDWISINPEAEISLDLAVFEKTFARARDVAGQVIDHALAEDLKTAVQLYQGDLLEGWYHDWCLCERERLQTNYLMMLDKLMSYCEANEKYETGLTYGLRVLRYDRARESTHRRLMRLHYLAGDRTAALRQYDHCVTALNEELGVKPSRLTVALYDKIRSDDLYAVVAQPSIGTNGDPNLLPRVIDHLKHLRRLLIKIQSQVRNDLKTIEEALDDWK